MRKIGCVCGYLSDRDREIFNRVVHMATERCVPMRDVFEDVAKSPASRFWIEEDRALRLMEEKRRGKVLKRQCRREMLSEIEQRTKALLESDPNKSLPDAVTEVIHSPAPSFYVSKRSVRRAVEARKHGFVPLSIRKRAISPGMVEKEGKGVKE